MRGARARRYAAGAGSAQICLMPSAGPALIPVFWSASGHPAARLGVVFCRLVAHRVWTMLASVEPQPHF